MSDAGKMSGSAELGGNTSGLPAPLPGPSPAQRQTQNPTQSDVQGRQPFPRQQDNVHDAQNQQPQPRQQEQPPVPPPPTHSADATVASPAAEVRTSSNRAQPPSRGQLQSEEAAVHLQDHADVKHEHKRSSWGGRFKSMLAAGAVAPINSLAHKLGSQSFLPEPLDKECNKAALILRAFCTKGVYADPRFGQPPASTDPQAKNSSNGLIDPAKEKPKNRLLVTIPPKIIVKAVGLAIFTSFRAGFQISGATGSGILIARLPDGSWGPPSAISVHSLGGGFQIGLDIYDCVCVINSREALSAFTNTRVSLGSDLAVAAGPYGAGAAAEHAEFPGKAPAAPEQKAGQSDILKPSGGDSRRRSSRSANAFKPVFSYVKSRGFYAGIQVDGTVVVERQDANSTFYGAPVTVGQILQGQVPPQGPNNMWPAGTRELMEALRGAERGSWVDQPRQHQHQNQQSHAAQSEVGPEEAGGAAPAFSAPAENMSANSTWQDNVCTGGSHADPQRSNTIGTQPGPAHHPLAGDASAAPPGYVDDGSHGDVRDAKYA
ncbi:hypothetical protein E4U53_006851 [Claviceps sorghi]|nr:hypothetical protein E4U53_006851 [Claviceps sorghi]